MNDDRMARPVSGEIMSGAAASPSARAARSGDVVDAEFVSMPAASVAPRAETLAAQAPIPPAAKGMDILKETDGPRSRRAGPAFWLFGLVLVGAAFWVSGGHALVSRPASPPPVVESDPREALRIMRVESRIEKDAGKAFVLVDGEVVNTGNRPAVLPPLDIRVTDGAGKSVRYVLGTGERRLAPSDRFPFSSRLEAPADGVGTVTVDFSTETN
ncbi:MAG: hypothetical protein KF849_11300 [Rhizobiaceae bacterium]|nr:hypothetical protein [Rhizobiaceae bacterium]